MIEKTTLSNGLRVLTETIANVHSVALGLWVGAGSRWEPHDQAGISHLVEHLLFKGTENRSTRELAEAMDHIGGNMNAYTTREFTCYTARVLTANLPQALDLLSDMILHPQFDAIEIQKEKCVILEEFSMYEDSPDELVHDLVIECLWHQQPLGRPVLGSRECLLGLTRQDIVKFHSHFYVPQNSVIVAVGNVDHQRFVDLVQKYFDDWAPVADWSLTSHSIPRITTNRCVRVKDVEQVHFCLGYEGRKLEDPEVYTLLTLSTLLGGSSSSRLFQRIREEHGLAYSIYTFQNSYRDTGLFGIYCATNPSTAQKALNLIKQELDRLQKNGVDHEELARAKGILKTELVLGLESSSSRMSRIGNTELMLGRPTDPDEALRNLENVTAEKINQLTEKMFKTEAVAIAAVAPTDMPFGDL